MPHRLPLPTLRRRCAAALAALGLTATVLSGCSGGVGGLSQQAVGAALPDPVDIGTGWELVGTTTQRPTQPPPGDAVTDAAASEPACHDALVALSGTAQEGNPTRFARSVYRHPSGTGLSADRDLTLTVEAFGTPPDVPGRVRAVTAACTEKLTTAAGIRKVTMTTDEHRYKTPGAVGYTVLYSTDGLRYSYDYVAVTRGQAVITASTTGPSAAANGVVLERAITLATARLAAAQGGGPSPP